MALNIDSPISNFFNTIASTSAFETVRKVQKVDTARLETQLQFAKFSDLGTPVLDYVELTLYDKVLNFYEDSTLTNIKETALLPNKSVFGATLHLNNVEVSTTKQTNIVRTSINGVSGTFKEFYNDGDLIINLTGSLIGTIPFQNDIQNLNNFSKINLANERFHIHSDFINTTFGVYSVIMSDFSLTLNKDYSNVVDYTITLESDIEIEIIY